MFHLQRKSFHLAFSLAWMCLVLMTGKTTSIEIIADEVIQVVENGTKEYLVLDCPYELSDLDEGLVIKYYHTNNPVQVYQWIAGAEPQALGILRDRLDLTYIAKDAEFHKHRALYMLRPTTELSGEYSCEVSSFEDEKEYRQKLIVYSKPAEVHVWTEKNDEDTVTVNCEVDDIFPEPEINLHIESEGENRTILAGTKEVKSWSQGSYNALIELEIDEDDLVGPVEFVCEVTIPDTDLVFPNATKYVPSKSREPEQRAEKIEKPKQIKVVEQAVMSGSGSRSNATFAIFLGLVALILCLF